MDDSTGQWYGVRYEHALGHAARLHRNQARKQAPGDTSTPVPYVAHLLEVSALIWEAGGSEDQAIAGLLHDALEDQSDHVTGEDLADRYGPDVRRMVESCSDGSPGLPRTAATWRQRKLAYLEHIKSASADEVLVSTADKIVNLRATLDDLAFVGPEVWSRFNASSTDITWYYSAFAETISSHHPECVLVNRLHHLVNQLAEAATAGARLNAEAAGQDRGGVLGPAGGMSTSVPAVTAAAADVEKVLDAGDHHSSGGPAGP